MDFERYSEEFDVALTASNEWDLPVDGTRSRFLDLEDVGLVMFSVQQTLRRLGLKGFSKNCGAVHTAQRELLMDRREGLNPVITIGWVKFDGRRYFETNRRKLRREMKKQAKRRTYHDTVDYHAWLTFRDGEALQLLDCTFGFYLYRHGVIGEMDILRFDTNSPEEHHFATEYYPLLAGRKTLEALCVLDEDWRPFGDRDGEEKTGK